MPTPNPPAWPSAPADSTITLLAGVLLFADSSPASEAQFEEANRLYETGRFPEAAALYRAAATNGVSANLLFNLGNAHFKAGQLGQAMAAYQRSLRLDPRNPETQANLRFAREQANTQPPALSLRQRWMRNALAWRVDCPRLDGDHPVFAPAGGETTEAGSVRGKPLWIRLPATGVVATALLLAMAASDYFSDSHAFVSVAKATVRNGPLEESPESFKATDGT